MTDEVTYERFFSLIGLIPTVTVYHMMQQIRGYCALKGAVKFSVNSTNQAADPT